MISDRRLHINSLINSNGEASPVTSAPRQAPVPSTQTTVSATNGVKPPVYRFEENGHHYYAYHNDVIYPFPSDDEELDRLDCCLEFIYGTALNGRYINAEVNLRSSHRLQILDVGYGTGGWAYTVAQTYPNVDVYNIDIIANQPNRDDVIPNAHFRSAVDFRLPDWGFHRHSFDLIHMGQLLGSVPDWLQLYKTASSYLRPGTGCIEHIEIDWAPRLLTPGHWPSDLSAIHHWWSYMVEASTRLGNSIVYRDDTEDLLMRAGFTDITHKTIRVCIQSSPQDVRDTTIKRWFLGIAVGENLGNGRRPTFDALSMSLFTRQLQFSREQVNELSHAVRECYSPSRSPFFHNIHVWTARKPSG